MENLNLPNKDYHAPMHTVEHILNSRMVSHFGCKRSFNAHIEKKKSKCDYHLDQAPSEEDMQQIEKQVNDIISQNIKIEEIFADKNNLPDSIDISKLPEEASSTLRLVKIGEFDICPCIGTHVQSTSEIGIFKIISYQFEEGVLRIRFKLL